jgi:putative membrane protein
MGTRFLTAVVAAVGLVGAGGAAGAVTEPPSALDSHWLQAAAQGDVFEYTIGKLALQKGSGGLCTVASMLVADHTKSLRQTQNLAATLKLKLPTRPNPFQANAIKALSTATGASFQELFALFGAGAHQLAILEAQEAGSKAGRSEVRAFARQQLPTLRKHLTRFAKLAKNTSVAKEAQAEAGATPTDGAAANGAGAATAAGKQGCSGNRSATPAPGNP